MKELLERLRLAWAGLTAREQQVTGIGGGLALLIIGYVAVWEPIVGARAAREQDLAEARRMAERIATLAAQAPAATATAANANTNLSLLAAVDQASKSSQLGKTPSRIQPDGDAQVRVWFEDVPFNNLLRWLVDLRTRYGVNVASLDIERESGPGLVNARLSLVR